MDIYVFCLIKQKVAKGFCFFYDGCNSLIISHSFHVTFLNIRFLVTQKLYIIKKSGVKWTYILFCLIKQKVAKGFCFFYDGCNSLIISHSFHVTFLNIRCFIASDIQRGNLIIKQNNLGCRLKYIFDSFHNWREKNELFIILS